jgi:RHS repeat-associated protein
MATSGARSVGHPIDVATGVVTTDATDFLLPSPCRLNLVRHYSTEMPERQGAPFGPGWCCEYEVTLRHDLEGYVLTTPSGGAVTFDEADRLPGSLLVIENHGAFHELRREGAWWIAARWDDGVAVRYWFRDAPGQSALPVERIEDATGQFRIVERGAAGLIARVRESHGTRMLEWKYGPHDRVVSVVLVRGTEERTLATCEYDGAGRLARVRDPGGALSGYEYDGAGRLVVEHTRDGGRFEFAYDAAGRCVHTTGLGGYDRQLLTYLTQEHTTVVEDSRGGRWTYHWRDDGQVERLISPLQSVETTVYDDLGRIVAEVDGENHETRFHYDARGNRSRVDHPDGTHETFTFDTRRCLRSLEDRTGAVWGREYDDALRLVAKVDPLGNRWEYAYDDRGQLVATVDPLGAAMHARYDGYGDLAVLSLPGGGTISVVRDLLGHVVEQVDAAGLVTRVERDASGLPLRVRLPGGSDYAFAYDTGGQLREFVAPDGRRTGYRFEPCRRLRRIEQPDGGSIEIAWGTAPGDLLTVRNEAGEVYAYEYDVEGRLLREAGFAGFGWRYEYDRAGRLSRVTADDGAVTKVGYDAAGRLVREHMADGDERVFAYDGEGRLLGARNRDVEVRIERDALGHAVREWQGDFVVASRYDAAGRRTGYDVGEGVRVGFEREPGHLVRRMAVDGAGDRGSAWAGRLEQDAAARLASFSLPGGISLGWEFLPSGLPGVRQTLRGGESVHTVRYEWRHAGQIASLADTARGLVQYEHDARGYAAAERVRDRARYRVPDAVGNVYATADRSDRVYGPGGMLLQAGEWSYRNGPGGERIEKRGRDGTLWRYEWNRWRELAAVVLPDGERVEFSYDALGRRVEKRSGGAATRYRWHGDDLIGEEAEGGETVWWVFDPTTGAPAVRVSGEHRHAVVCDHLGTPSELYDGTGRLAWRMTLDLYGAASIEGDASLCAWRWPGQYADTETGLCYNRFRYYDPHDGIYLSPDPLGLAAGPRLFAYVRDPTVEADPFGLSDTISVWHYTSDAGFKSIPSGGVWHFNASTPACGHPYGVYFTSKFDPGQTSELHRMGIPADKRTHFFEVQVDRARFGDIFHPLPGGRGETGVSIYIPSDVEVKRILQNEWENKKNRNERTMRQGACGKVG